MTARAPHDLLRQDRAPFRDLYGSAAPECATLVGDMCRLFLLSEPA